MSVVTQFFCVDDQFEDVVRTEWKPLEWNLL